jgi:hypothetical protein
VWLGKIRGLVDLWVNDPVVPWAFRQPEEVVALAVAGESPARILKAIPALLAWHRWSCPQFNFATVG